MESVWLFPSSFNEWKENGSTNMNSIDAELDSALMSNDLIVNQPVESDVVSSRPRKKKKKKITYKDSQQTFNDKYTLSSEILGEGANSVVALAKENNSGKDFAVKIIDKYEGYDRSSVLREIDLLHFLSDCPNVLHLHDSYEEVDRFYVVFEKMDGGPLLHHIQNKKFFTEREASLVVNDIAVALKFLHDRGISHRDLKPDNILCVNTDQIVPIVICDFNLASGISMMRGDTTPDLYTPVGSAEFMAPEVVDAFVRDAPAYDKRCDLWSLGVILYIMLSGRPPFQGNCGKDCDWERGGSCRDCQSMLWHSILDEDFSFPDEEWSMVSLEAKDLISHMLVKEPSKRYTVDSVLSHPWLLMASNNLLKTPAVLSSEVHAHRLSTVTSEAIAYRRIISERQKKEEDYQLITRWSTPPKFGLSPPGNSKLAQRRSLKRLNFSNGHSPDETGKENLKNSIIGGTLQESPDNSLLCRQFEHCLKTRLSDPVLTKAFSETFDEQMNGFLNSSPEEMALSQVKITR